MARNVYISVTADTKRAVSNVDQLNDSLDETSKAAKKAGDATKDLTEDVTKNGGAMGLLNELTGGLAQKFKDSYEAIQLSATGLKGWRAALAATGIGAAVVAIGLLIENWDTLSAAMSGVNEQQKEFNSLQIEAQIQANQSTSAIERLASVVTDETRSQIEREKALKDLSGTVKELKDLDVEQGANLINNTNLLDRYIKSIQARAKAEAFAKIIAEKQAEILRKTSEGIQDASQWYDVLLEAINPALNAQGARIAKLGEEVAEEEKLIIQLEKVLEENLRIAEQGEAQTAAFENNEAKKVEAVKGRIESIKGIEIEEAEDDWDRLNAGLDAQRNIDKLRLDSVRERVNEESAFNEQLREQELRKAEFEIELAQRTQEAKVMVAQQALFAIGNIFGRESAAGKAAAIAQATISTYQAAANALATTPLPPPGPQIAAAAAIAGGIAQVRNIVATQIPNQFGSGGGGASGGVSTNIPQPNIPAISFGGNNIGNQIAGAIQGQPIRAYVTTKDINNANELDRRVRSSAVIG